MNESLTLIINGDGPEDTYVFFGDKQLMCIQNFELKIDSDNQLPRLNFNLYGYGLMFEIKDINSLITNQSIVITTKPGILDKVEVRYNNRLIPLIYSIYISANVDSITKIEIDYYDSWGLINHMAGFSSYGLLYHMSGYNDITHKLTIKGILE